MLDFVRAFEPGPPAAQVLLDALAEPEIPDDTFGLFGTRRGHCSFLRFGQR